MTPISVLTPSILNKSSKYFTNTFETDLQQIVNNFKRAQLSLGHLGNALNIMGMEGRLFPEIIKIDDEFKIYQKRQLNDVTVEYLNYLENEKLFQCRLCYSHADWLWCDFHRKHLNRQIQHDLTNDIYVDFLNSDMAVISFVERYYFMLSSFSHKEEATSIIKELTNYNSLADLMNEHNFTFSKTKIDVNAYELMDFD
ncbi:ac34 [Oxyplax ochracea nucleopolyhedrovirus]|uniref:Ac34 n=1 Tax=Oxyplax ochracea nucleopolyhedrovirus TaxID=2083176 RepID=A0A2L0WU90_9ABAC|nr:ac34 [Oxyplax ochracea nucleopolyhedrovirus]AVA31216.1 ac34 [Oxyplax ochracea nucleopolyhedrovirus]